MKLFRGGIVFKAHRCVYHSPLGWRVIETKTQKLELPFRLVAGASVLGGEGVCGGCPISYATRPSASFGCVRLFGSVRVTVLYVNASICDCLTIESGVAAGASVLGGEGARGGSRRPGTVHPNPNSHTYICIYIYMYAYVYIYTDMFINIYIYTYIYIYI